MERRRGALSVADSASKDAVQTHCCPSQKDRTRLQTPLSPAEPWQQPPETERFHLVRLFVQPVSRHDRVSSVSYARDGVPLHVSQRPRSPGIAAASHATAELDGPPLEQQWPPPPPKYNGAPAKAAGHSPQAYVHGRSSPAPRRIPARRLPHARPRFTLDLFQPASDTNRIGCASDRLCGTQRAGTGTRSRVSP
jgi:hypothetical protein